MPCVIERCSTTAYGVFLIYIHYKATVVQSKMPTCTFVTAYQGFPLRANARPRRTVWLKNGKGTQNGKENGSFQTHMV